MPFVYQNIILPYDCDLISIQGGGTTSSNFFTNALISSTATSQYHDSLKVNSHIITAAAAGLLDMTYQCYNAPY
jgi:hypothetical protein